MILTSTVFDLFASVTGRRRIDGRVLRIVYCMLPHAKIDLRLQCRDVESHMAQCTEMTLSKHPSQLAIKPTDYDLSVFKAISLPDNRCIGENK